MIYKKIIVPLDGSKLAEQILPFTRLLAQGLDIPVELLRVNDPANITPYAPPLQGGDYLKEISELHFHGERPVTCTVELGSPAEKIITQAAADPGALIAMATHGLSGMRRWLLGSVASKVVQAAANPVLLMRPTADGNPPAKVGLSTVFVPLDGSALAEKILPHVIDLAKKMSLEVNLLRTYSLPTQSYLVGNTVPTDTISQQKEVSRREAENYLEAKTQELRAQGLDRVISTAIEGNAADEIIDVAAKTPNSVIAMSTHGRSGLGRWVLGSVAEKVIQFSGDPVLVIRPSSSPKP